MFSRCALLKDEEIQMEVIDQQWPCSVAPYIDVRALSQLDTMLCSLSPVLL